MLALIGTHPRCELGLSHSWFRTWTACFELPAVCAIIAAWAFVPRPCGAVAASAGDASSPTARAAVRIERFSTAQRCHVETNGNNRRSVPTSRPLVGADRPAATLQAMANHRVTLIPGDGIGPEVAEATRLVLDAADVGIEWIEMPAGAGALDTHGALLPDETVDAIRACRVGIKGPITTPVGTGFRSVNVALRLGLDLFASVRPARSLPGVPTRHDDVDLVIVRENTEDLYQGIEFERGSEEAAALKRQLHDVGGLELVDNAGITLKPISLTGAHRIVRFAFEYARSHRRKHITVGHKANVMRYSDGIFLDAAIEDARDFPDIDWEEIQIDHLSSRLARTPEDFDVLLLPNLYGDIISDLCAGLVGGLGLIPGANIGWEYAVFEAVHGSAPDIAGKGLANPVAMILSGAMLLRHIGEIDAAENVEWGVDETLRKQEVRTPDLGGTASTMAFAEAIAAEAVAWEHGPS